MESLTRRHFFRTALPVVSLGALASSVWGVETSDLKERLEKDLRARRPAEFAFINKVVKLVNRGILPLGLVDGTYLWARRKHTNRFQYFEAALRERARRIGVEL